MAQQDPKPTDEALRLTPVDTDESVEDNAVEALHKHLSLARAHLASASDLLIRLEAGLLKATRPTDENPSPQLQVLRTVPEKTPAEPAMPDTRGPEDWAPRLDAWLDRQPPVVVARGLAISLLVASTVLLWQQGDAALATVVWVIATLAFVAVCVPGCLPSSRWAVPGVFIALAFLGALTLRLVGIDQLALGVQGDEATTALATQETIRGVGNLFQERAFAIPTLGYVWFIPLMQLVASPIDAVRATSAIAGAGTVVMVGIWGWTLGGPRLAVIAACLLAASHTALYFSHLGTSNSIALFFSTSVTTLLTVALVRRSLAAAALTSVALVGVWCTWAGGREVLPLLALAPVVAWHGVRRLGALGPSALAVGGAVALLAGPALSLGGDHWPVFAFPRVSSALLVPDAWQHAADGARASDVLTVTAYQSRGVLVAFEPQTVGDASPFYQFDRPFVDTLTLFLAFVGLLVAITLIRRQRAWLLVISVPAIVLLASVATINPPDYPRLLMMLPAMALLAAIPLAWLSTRGRQGLVLAIGLTSAICLLNLWWFFVDYPREGHGNFDLALLADLAQRGPVYVVTPGFYFNHETLQLLDPRHNVQPPPQDPDGAGVWAAVGPDAQTDIAALQPYVADDRLQTFTDNTGRVVVYALVPPGR
jgi:hypothetical protein